MNESRVTRVRSWLFTPGTRPDRFDKAAASGADVSIIDLEDSVAPGDKAEARRTALTHLSQPAAGSCGRALRINALVTRVGLADLQALFESEACPDYLVLPKAESAAHLQILDHLSSTERAKAGTAWAPLVYARARLVRHSIFFFSVS